MVFRACAYTTLGLIMVLATSDLHQSEDVQAARLQCVFDTLVFHCGLSELTHPGNLKQPRLKNLQHALKTVAPFLDYLLGFDDSATDSTDSAHSLPDGPGPSQPRSALMSSSSSSSFSASGVERRDPFASAASVSASARLASSFSASTSASGLDLLDPSAWDSRPFSLACKHVASDMAPMLQTLLPECVLPDSNAHYDTVHSIAQMFGVPYVALYCGHRLLAGELVRETGRSCFAFHWCTRK